MTDTASQEELDYYAGLSERELKNCARTPPALFESLRKEFPFSLDAAATRHDALLARFNVPGLSPHRWDDFDWVWCNPPWTWSKHWVKKAHDHAERGECSSVLLVPTGNSKWMSEFGWRADRREFEARPKFDPPPGLTYSTPRADAQLLIFRAGQLNNDRGKLQVARCDALGRVG